MKKLRTEEQIIASWKGDFDKPVVSICCATYNHESYIKKTLEGFLIQETDFSFEILIYDDASTDNNANIIREYEAKYPRLIKPIYQTINKYSQGIKTNPVFNWLRAKGEYSALCEGDDYWFSAEKLQVQIELMKRYSDINLSFHPSYISDKDSKNKKKLFCNYGDEIKIFSPEKVILGGGEFMPSPSLVIKSKVLNSLPEWYFNLGIDGPGDVYLQIISAIPSGVLYLPKLRCVYRVNVPGSWTSRLNNRSCESINKEAVNRQKNLLALNNSSKEFYQRSFYSAIARDLLSLSFRALSNNCYELFKTLINKSSGYKSNLNITQKIFMLFCNYPKLLKILIKIPLKIKDKII